MDVDSGVFRLNDGTGTTEVTIDPDYYLDPPVDGVDYFSQFGWKYRTSGLEDDERGD
jgi:hypothetical protein